MVQRMLRQFHICRCGNSIIIRWGDAAVGTMRVGKPARMRSGQREREVAKSTGRIIFGPIESWADGSLPLRGVQEGARFTEDQIVRILREADEGGNGGEGQETPDHRSDDLRLAQARRDAEAGG